MSAVKRTNSGDHTHRRVGGTGTTVSIQRTTSPELLADPGEIGRIARSISFLFSAE